MTYTFVVGGNKSHVFNDNLYFKTLECYGYFNSRVPPPKFFLACLDDFFKYYFSYCQIDFHN